MGCVEKKLIKSKLPEQINKTISSYNLKPEEFWVIRHRKRYIDKRDEEAFENE